MPPMSETAALALPVWPEGQAWQKLDVSQIAVTQFADVEQFHPQLHDAVIAASADLRYHDPAHYSTPSACGRKVRDVAQWESPAAQFVHARAMTFAQRALARPQLFADDTWASIYGKGDYCMPHSHIRADASVVYMLDPGDPDPTDVYSGCLYFADPRIAWSCPVEPGRVVRPFIPKMPAGAMVLFAGEYLHGVHTYRGNAPRITMSWNITLTPREGGARDWAFELAKGG